ncbi:hypothetical protein Vadar_020495 [Vaccinium darrowii]|uniref:Uncharacterized protein n=1 Tax=Vaccinium darrowii TaxID=229202 RepID=A0ACB7YH19_9ERIC|nr:hypothetical protein Vadar_020495 [Vaccinium darrowii]
MIRRLNRNYNDPLKDQVVSLALETKYGLNPMKLMGILVACLMLLSVVFSVSVILEDLPSESIWSGAESRVLQEKPHQEDSEDDSPQDFKVAGDKLLGGLLTTGFDERSCVSRYQAVLYSKVLTHNPSPYLISRLRSYEALHKRCGPHTEPYNKTIELLKKSGKQTGPSDCNYVVWISFSGLGNRILTLASTFLYSLLTNRVLLVDRGADIADLFCEPFPDVSWLLPTDFPLASQFSHFDQKSVHSYGNMVKNNILEVD